MKFLTKEWLQLYRRTESAARENGGDGFYAAGIKEVEARARAAAAATAAAVERLAQEVDFDSLTESPVYGIDMRNDRLSVDFGGACLKAEVLAIEQKECDFVAPPDVLHAVELYFDEGEGVFGLHLLFGRTEGTENPKSEYLTVKCSNVYVEEK